MRFYIEKNTPELRQKLESMGFTKNPFISQENLNPAGTGASFLLFAATE